MSQYSGPHFNADTPFHRLGQYQAWEISERFDCPIDMIWISVADSIDPACHRVLPHGEPSIAILRERGRDGLISDVRLTLCGPSHEAIWYHPAPKEELIAVRLRPEWSAVIFGISPPEFLGTRSNCFEAPRFLEFACRNSLAEAETDRLDAQKLAELLLNDLVGFAQQTVSHEKAEHRAIHIIRSLNGQIRAKSVAQHLDISERHLRRRVRDILGCSPKQYARQLRLTSAVLEAEKLESPNWAQLASAFGFHDQAHMINEFQSMLQMTPSDLQKERRALAAFSNI